MMSARLNLAGKIFSDIYVIDFIKENGTHAVWRCICMPCAKVLAISSSNLKSGNSNSCSSCSKKTTSYRQDCEIKERLDSGDSVAGIARDYKVNRSVIYRIIRERLEELKMDKCEKCGDPYHTNEPHACYGSAK